MPASTDNSKCASRPGGRPTEQAARIRRLCSNAGPTPNEAAGCRRKIAARLTERISRSSSRTCLSIASALREWVRMAEKSRKTRSVWAAEREAAGPGSCRAAGLVSETAEAEGEGAWVVGGACHNRSNKAASIRGRTGLDKTWEAPLK